jgi:hypothetical protein
MTVLRKTVKSKNIKKICPSLAHEKAAEQPPPTGEGRAAAFKLMSKE